MTLRKRMKVIFAAVTQSWHQKVCGDCGEPWWSEGRDRQLICICDRCEARLLDRMFDTLEREYQRQKFPRGA